MDNPIIQTLLAHRSVRKYKPDQPPDEVVKMVVRAGQQAPFVSQLYSVLLTRKHKAPFGAPLWFTICVDLYKLERFMKVHNWEVRTNDLSLLLFGIQDAAYMAQNMVVAGESLGLFSCFLGSAPYMADRIAKEFKLPSRVFPLVQLVMGYPAEEFPTRPRWPLWFTLFEEHYPDFSDEQVAEAMKAMDDGYLEQGYYKKQKQKFAWMVGARRPTPTKITPGPSTSRVNGASGTNHRRNCWSSCARGALIWRENNYTQPRLDATGFLFAFITPML